MDIPLFPGLASAWPAAAGSRLGLVARLPLGLTFLLPSFNLSLFLLPSLISPPDPAPSPSLPEPALPPRGLFRSFPRVAVGFFCKPGLFERPAFESELIAGEREREGGPLGVLTPDARLEVVPCCFFCFFLADSFPLASDRLGDPARFNDFEEAFR